jgi:hypothetical protein
MTEPRVTIALVRAAIVKRVEDTSLREVADEIGMSFSGLRSFIEGGSPHARTRVKLMHWYYRRSRGTSAPPREDVETAIALVLSYVEDDSTPRSVQERRRREMLERLRADSEA